MLPERPMQRVNSARIVRALAMLLLLAALPGKAQSAYRGKSIVLISVDTLRADHLGCYGYTRPTSPHIDRFAASATRFRRAYATAPWTIPSHASMFTGKYAFEHGAHSVQVNRPVNNVKPLPKEHRTLAEVLRDEGFRTGAFVANAGYLGPSWQLDQGFESWQVEPVYGDELNRHVFAWLEALGRGQPFFLFVNYIDTHWPYNVGRAREFPLGPSDSKRRRSLMTELYLRVMADPSPAPAELLQEALNRYDTAIVNLDESLGALLKHLDELGLAEDSVIILTSDHGEYFGEHRLVEHSKDVYEPALQVPLILRMPGQRQGQVSELAASSVDVPRLVLAHLSAQLEERYASLFPNVVGDHELLAENYYSRTKDLFNEHYGKRFDRVRTAYFDLPFKLIESSDGKHELYDLSADPDELENLLLKRPELTRRLRDDLQVFLNANPRYESSESGPPPLDEAEKERLRALGYIE